MSELKAGKRYWFHNQELIYSALCTGEIDPYNGNQMFQRKNGEEWSIPDNDVFDSLETLLEYTGLKHYKLCD